MDMETIAHIRRRNEAPDDDFMPAIGPGAAVVMLLFCAFFWLCAAYGLPSGIRAVAGLIQWLGQPLAEVIR